MGNNEKRKAWDKLVRPPYNFAKQKLERTREDLIALTQDCLCNEAPGVTGSDEVDDVPTPSGIDEKDDPLDPNPEPSDDCLVDEYTFCGHTNADQQEKIPRFYLRVLSDTENPDVIFVPDAVEGGACLQKSDQINCDDARGQLLGPDDYTPIDGSCEDDPACNAEAPEWVFLELCDDDPVADDTFFSPREIYVHASFFPSLVLPLTVSYRFHCYHTPPLSLDAFLSQEDFDAVSNPVVPDMGELRQEGSCQDQQCRCCDDASDNLFTLNTAMQNRIRFVNGDTLPTGFAAHDWGDPDYILNNHPDTIDGPLVDCFDRAETWRLYLNEIEYWLKTSDYLYAKPLPDKWLNIAVHPAGEIEGASALTLYSASDYETHMTASIDHTWYRNAFATNAVGEKYTIGGEGGFGSISVIRFGDTLPHVTVRSQQFCDLLNSTISRMMVTVQSLLAVRLQALFSDLEGKNTGQGGAELTPCGTVRSCLNANHPSTAFGDDRRFSVSGGCILSSTDPASNNGFIEAQEFLDQGFFAGTNSGFLFNARGKIHKDMTTFTAGTPTAKSYLKVNGQSGGLSQTPPVTGDALYHFLETAQPGTDWLSSLIGDDTAEFTMFPEPCPSPGVLKGWKATDKTVIIKHQFAL